MLFVFEMDPPFSLLRGFSLCASLAKNFNASYSCYYLEKATILQVIFDDDIGDRIEYKANVVRIGGTC